MGMFDSIYVQYDLPKIIVDDQELSFLPGHEFQSKDLHCMMDSYLISTSGRLIYRELSWSDKRSMELSPYKDVDFHGFLNFYTTYKNDDTIHIIDFIAKFTDGNIVTIDYIVNKY
jgi:hypothetical protein